MLKNAKFIPRMNNEDEICSICLEIYDKECIIIPLTNCTHCFHEECIYEWIRNKRVMRNNKSSCPVCRTPVTLTEIDLSLKYFSKDLQIFTRDIIDTVNGDVRYVRVTDSGNMYGTVSANWAAGRVAFAKFPLTGYYCCIRGIISKKDPYNQGFIHFSVLIPSLTHVRSSINIISRYPHNTSFIGRTIYFYTQSGYGYIATDFFGSNGLCTFLYEPIPTGNVTYPFIEVDSGWTLVESQTV